MIFSEIHVPEWNVVTAKIHNGTRGDVEYMISSREKYTLTKLWQVIFQAPIFRDVVDMNFGCLEIKKLKH